MTRGLFVVIDGVDGAGKSTQTTRLAAALVAKGRRVHVTAEPSALPIGATIREHLRGPRERAPAWDTMALLFAADRLDHVAREIAPQLAAGVDVICDRYDASSIAYQTATAPAELDRGAVAKWIARVNDRAMRPDLTLLFDLEPDLALARRARRGAAEELYEARAIQLAVRAEYGRLRALRPDDRIVVIDANADADAVHARVLGAITPLLTQ
ncbi:MAG: dTMP kinase [Polyangiales bacterium]